MLEVNWSPAASGISLPDDAAAQLAELWEEFAQPASYAVPQDAETSALEGAVRYRMVRHKKREQWLRDAKIKDALSKGALRCEVPDCGFDFKERYGALGDGYAHVHHTNPLADYTGPQETRMSDLAIVCANCHAMIHRGGESRSLEEIAIL